MTPRERAKQIAHECVGWFSPKLTRPEIELEITKIIEREITLGTDIHTRQGETICGAECESCAYRLSIESLGCAGAPMATQCTRPVEFAIRPIGHRVASYRCTQCYCQAVIDRNAAWHERYETYQRAKKAEAERDRLARELESAKSQLAPMGEMISRANKRADAAEQELDQCEAFAEMVVSRLVTAGHDYARDSHLTGCDGCRSLRSSVDALYATAPAIPSTVIQASSKSVPNLDEARPATATKCDHRDSGFDSWCALCGELLDTKRNSDNLDSHMDISADDVACPQCGKWVSSNEKHNHIDNRSKGLLEAADAVFSWYERTSSVMIVEVELLKDAADDMRQSIANSDDNSSSQTSKEPK